MSNSSRALNSPFAVPRPRDCTTSIGKPASGGQLLRSRRLCYTPTPEKIDPNMSASKLQLFAPFPVYEDKSHRELRWKDYQLRYKGRPDVAVQSATSVPVIGSLSKQPNFLSTSGVNLPASGFQSAAPSKDEYMKEDNLTLRNLTLLLAYLCIFGVCSSDLVYDFLNILSQRLTGIDVSTILTVLQCRIGKSITKTTRKWQGYCRD